MNFKLVSDFEPTGDQPKAIEDLTNGILNNEQHQTLLGVTGSGKTFTIANVIQNINRPTLILSHNKTLASQLYEEFKNFFPENKVEYFVSYYDYYQPEAFIPATNTYIEKDLSINDKIEQMRLSTSSALMSGRRDIIVVSSVSCIYGIGNPESFKNSILNINKGEIINRNTFLGKLVEINYVRTKVDLLSSNFRVNGDTVEINLPYTDENLKIVFWDNEIESIETYSIHENKKIESFNEFIIYPANIFVTPKDVIQTAIREIQDDLIIRVDEFIKEGKTLEAKRLEERVNWDLEMIRELGYCSGVENYSRYFDRREQGSRPFCLLDFFPKDYITVIDESHVTVSQINAMYGGDRSRKINLVEYGFRLPSAIDNRPLKFQEFENITNQTIYVSATPNEYELNKSEGIIIEQLIRPTGLLDPVIEIRPSENQIDDLIDEIKYTISKSERVLITTLTKRMAEELNKYLLKFNIKCQYIHSDVDTLERVEILNNLRSGIIEVLIGVNLLREGLDLPEVSLVVILDADKEGFLRSEKSLVQTVGRAARNINGKVIFYADKMTKSMQKTIDETNRRRSIQQEYNIQNNITPRQIVKNNSNIFANYNIDAIDNNLFVAEDESEYLTKNQLLDSIKKLEKQMKKAADDLDFILASKLRDKINDMKKKIN